MTSTQTLISAITVILADDGWRPRWAAWTNNAMADEYGNTVAIHDQGESLRVEFEYALPGLVETMNLDPSHGARRIALTILALASPAE